MTIKKLVVEGYTSEQLKAMCDLHAITDFSECKNPSRPSKLEMVERLNSHYLSNNIEGVDETDSEDPLNNVPKNLTGSNGTNSTETKPEEKVELSKSAKRRIQLDLMRKRVRAVVTLKAKASTQIVEVDSNSGEDVDFNEVLYITWGNDLIGHHRSKVVLGVPWQYPEGCLQNLRNAKFTYEKKIKNSYMSVTVSKYDVSILDPLTEEELEKLKEEQKYIDTQLKMTNELGR